MKMRRPSRRLSMCVLPSFTMSSSSPPARRRDPRRWKLFCTIAISPDEINSILSYPHGTLHELTFEIGGAARRANIDTLIAAGWTGRDRAAVEHHIAELAAVGVQRPTSIPCFYRLGPNLLTHAETIDVVGSHSSGEVEFVLISLENGLHVGVGSDHTDRRVEAYSVTVSKQMCPKPLGRELWTFAEVAGHWDDLVLRSWVTRDGTRQLYQEGSVTKMLAAMDLIERYLG